MTAQDEIKAEFLRDELDYIHAIEALQEHCGMTAREAEALVSEWELDKL